MRHPDVCIGDLAPRRRLCARYRHGPEYGEAAGAAHHGRRPGRPITATRPGRPIMGRPGR